jgi:hypothetical protein
MTTFEYRIAPCLGMENVAQAISEMGREGFEPIICTFSGVVEAKKTALGPPVSAPSYLLILRRPTRAVSLDA